MSIFKQTYLVKLCPIFDGSAPSCLTIYKKILWRGSLGCKKTIEIHLPHYKIPQQSPHYFTLAFDLIFGIIYFSFAQKIRTNLELPVFSNPFFLDAGTKPFVIHFDIGLQPGNISSLYLLCLSFKIFQNSSNFRYSILSLLTGC